MPYVTVQMSSNVDDGAVNVRMRVVRNSFSGRAEPKFNLKSVPSPKPDSDAPLKALNHSDCIAFVASAENGSIPASI